MCVRLMRKMLESQKSEKQGCMTIKIFDFITKKSKLMSLVPNTTRIRDI